MLELILLLQAASTLAMVGLIWFVQIVHYPLFAQVGREGFSGYEQAHQNRTTFVVAPLMLVEAITALLLLWFQPAGVTQPAVIAGVALLGLVWASTIFWQVPAHARLENSFSADSHRWLVRSNWVRTAGWTARGLLVCWMISQMSVHASSANPT